MRQRLAIATALIGDPKILVLDEPFNGLDPEQSDELSGLIRRQANCGVAVLVSTHQLDEAQRACDEVVILNHGRVQAFCDLTQSGAKIKVIKVTPEAIDSAVEVAGRCLGLPVTFDDGLQVPYDKFDAIMRALFTGGIVPVAVHDLQNDLGALYRKTVSS